PVVVNHLVTEVPATFDPHKEDKYDDFFNERNIPMLLSQEGPKAAIGDVNKDGKEDVYLCGAKGQGGQLYLQTGNTFKKSPQKVFQDLSGFEDTAAAFFDCDGDGDLDLVVGSGGNESAPRTQELPTRLYLNDGKGNFVINTKALPPNGMNTAVIVANDYDKDGDIDLFVGSRSVPREYGISPTSYIYQNDGHGIFKEVGKTIAPELTKIGMIRDAFWADVNGDKKEELIVVGDWMAPSVFEFKGGKFKKLDSGLEKYSGFWGSLKVVDTDSDGDMDLVMGNTGENFSLTASEKSPLKIWINDFNKNGNIDKVMTKTVDSRDMPVLLKRDLTTQFPFLKKKNIKHSEYANNSIQDLFPGDIMSSTYERSVNYLKSAIAVNDGKGHFTLSPLPDMVQLSCLNAIESSDFNMDGKPDLVVGGNFSHFIPQLGALDACRGNVLINKGNNKFDVLLSPMSGYSIDGELKQISSIMIGGKSYLINLVNNSKPVLFRINKG
ncbi:MAG: VCBS repeat-containing protein, partial [Dyadobacter sp.]